MNTAANTCRNRHLLVVYSFFFFPKRKHYHMNILGIVYAALNVCVSVNHQHAMSLILRRVRQVKMKPNEIHVRMKGRKIIKHRAGAVTARLLCIVLMSKLVNTYIHKHTCIYTHTLRDRLNGTHRTHSLLFTFTFLLSFYFDISFYLSRSGILICMLCYQTLEKKKKLGKNILKNVCIACIQMKIHTVGTAIQI